MFLDLFLSGAAAAALSGFLVAIAIILLLGRAEGLAYVIPLGLWAACYALVLVTLPAMILGGILWGFRIRHTVAWASVGLLAGLGFHIYLWGLPSTLDPAVLDPQAILFAAIDGAIGAVGALTFRRAMRTLSRRAGAEDGA